MHFILGLSNCWYNYSSVNWRVKTKEIDFFLKDSEAKSIVYEEFSSEDVKFQKMQKFNKYFCEFKN